MRGAGEIEWCSEKLFVLFKLLFMGLLMFILVILLLFMLFKLILFV